MSQPLHIHLLGDFCVLDDDTPMTALHAPRLQALIAYLVLHRTTPQSRQQIAFCLWPESLESQAQTNLRHLLHQLRHRLPHADSYLRMEGATLRWRADGPFTLDVADFLRAIDAAKQARQQDNHFDAQAALEAAITSYQGDLLPSCYDEWIIPERERLRQLFTAALEQLVALLEAQRDYSVAIRTAQRLIQTEPLHEANYLRLLRLYALSGDHAAALHTYQTCAAVLARELNTAPGQPLQEAYARLSQINRPMSPPPSPAKRLPLVGCQSEWCQLLAHWQAAAAGQPQVVLLSGEAGMGKTRLAEELLHWVAQQGFATARAACYATEGELAYAPLVAWLRAPALQAKLRTLHPIWRAELARLVPDLLAPPSDLPPPLLGDSRPRQRLFDALAHAVLRIGQPQLLLLDDLQWCDQATLAWLAYLCHDDRQAQFLLLGTLRPEELTVDHPLAALLSAWRARGQVAEIELVPLSEGETAALARQVSAETLTPAQLSALYHETEGNPLFVVETIRARASDQRAPAIGAPERVDALRRPALAPRIQAVIAARLAQLTPLAHDLVGLAATTGRTFSFAVLALASGVDESTLLRELDELCRRRIFHECSDQHYDFSHTLLREVAYWQLSATRRRKLHHDIAAAMETLLNQYT